jgi:hypothetical protein
MDGHQRLGVTGDVHRRPGAARILVDTAVDAAAGAAGTLASHGEAGAVVEEMYIMDHDIRGDAAGIAGPALTTVGCLQHFAVVAGDPARIPVYETRPEKGGAASVALVDPVPRLGGAGGWRKNQQSQYNTQDYCGRNVTKEDVPPVVFHTLFPVRLSLKICSRCRMLSPVQNPSSAGASADIFIGRSPLIINLCPGALETFSDLRPRSRPGATKVASVPKVAIGICKVKLGAC